jgi:hypothetical protein
MRKLYCILPIFLAALLVLGFAPSVLATSESLSYTTYNSSNADVDYSQRFGRTVTLKCNFSLMVRNTSTTTNIARNALYYDSLTYMMYVELFHDGSGYKVNWGDYNGTWNNLHASAIILNVARASDVRLVVSGQHIYGYNGTTSVFNSTTPYEYDQFTDFDAVGVAFGWTSGSCAVVYGSQMQVSIDSLIPAIMLTIGFSVAVAILSSINFSKKR